MTILRVDASMRTDGSVSRSLSDKLVAKLSANGATVVTRDLADGVALIDQNWIFANFTDDADRSPDQKAALALSDKLIAEVKAADTIVIGAPIYNFSVPAALKAWIDLICRARLTFQYTENGPVGLLSDKKVYIVVASGGVPVDSPVDFMTPYLKQVMNFIGLTDITVIDGSQLMADEAAALERANGQIDAA